MNPNGAGMQMLPVVVLLIGCASNIQSTRITSSITDPAIMKSTLQQRIPPRTSVAETKSFMEREGFRCSTEWDGSASKHEVSGDSDNSISFDRQDQVDTFVSRRWQIKVTLKDGAVDDMNVTQGLIGP